MSFTTTGLIQSPDESLEYFFVEGCHILETWNRAEDPNLSIVRARVTPGVTTRWHRLRGTIERYLILAGTGVMELHGIPPRPVGPGDLVYIPSDHGQRITNTGSSDLIFLALCTPRFRPEVYEDLEQSSDA
ncbi:cupin [Thiocapsa imhoffii]|uniref:Cupin n=1 Tax=Thiocapsa imhoffii TaxID=382777 RepID=A0A9X0WG11_9GAMM|nr:cupin domain-containing protein [Thiocapsa imhoffii]MBK1643928.1 cupin [Thiocapsa imhoffii]